MPRPRGPCRAAGSAVASGYFGDVVRAVLSRAGVERPMREYHGWRHTGITNAAAAGTEPMAIMRMAGHADFKTTQRYIDLAEVVFGDEVRKLGDWYVASAAGNRYQLGSDRAESRLASDAGPSGG